jgi:hypothetical protein
MDAVPDDLEKLKLRQIIANIDQKQADAERKRHEARLAPWQIGITLMGGAAAFFAAGAAFVKLVGG